MAHETRPHAPRWRNLTQQLEARGRGYRCRPALRSTVSRGALRCRCRIAHPLRHLKRWVLQHSLWKGPLCLPLCHRLPLLISSAAPLARAYTLHIVLANCLHSFTDRGENLKIKNIEVKAKVKAKDRNDGEGEGSEGKKQHYYSVCAYAHAREEERKRGGKEGDPHLILVPSPSTGSRSTTEEAHSTISHCVSPTSEVVFSSSEVNQIISEVNQTTSEVKLFQDDAAHIGRMPAAPLVVR